MASIHPFAAETTKTRNLPLEHECKNCPPFRHNTISKAPSIQIHYLYLEKKNLNLLQSWFILISGVIYFSCSWWNGEEVVHSWTCQNCCDWMQFMVKASLRCVQLYSIPRSKSWERAGEERETESQLSSEVWNTLTVSCVHMVITGR